MDPALFPLSEWRECSRQALSVDAVRDWCTDHFTLDDSLLVEQIRTRLLPRRGVRVGADEILVTVGAQHALYLLAALLVNGETHGRHRGAGLCRRAEYLRAAHVEAAAAAAWTLTAL